MSDIWKDPNVKAALKEGRPPDDIAVLQCPKCAEWGYYNEGSHFYCRTCQHGFHCVSEGEEVPDDRPYLFLEGSTTLADLTQSNFEGDVP